MANPWEDYASQAAPAATQDGPWSTYGAAPATPLAQPAAPDSTALQRVGNVLNSFGNLHDWGLAARAATTGLTGTVGLAGDTLNKGINAIAGTHLAPFSTALQDAMTQLGVPQPQTTQEKISGVLGSVLAGSRDPLMTGISKALPGLMQRYYGGPTAALYPQTAPVTGTLAQTIRNAQDAGISVPPNEARAGTAGRAVEAIAGKPATEAIIRQRNVAAIDDLARSAAGLPKTTPLTVENLNNAINETYTNGYKPIMALGTIPTGPQYKQALNTALQDFQGVSGSFPAAAKAEVQSLINSYRVSSFKADDAIRAIAQLRADAKSAFDAGNGALGGANRAIATALENNIETQLATRDAELLKQGVIEGTMQGNKLSARASGSDLLAQFREARTQLAKQYAVRDAIIPGAGSVNALNLAAQLRSGAPLTGELRTIAEIANIAPKATAFPKNAPQLFTGLEGTSLLGGGLASLFGGGLGGTLAAGIPLSRLALRHTIASRLGQQLLAQPAAAPALNAPHSILNTMPTLYNMGNGLFNQEAQQQ